MPTCLSCGKQNSSLVCLKCRNNPYIVEECRKILATNNSLHNLRYLYFRSHKSIRNINNAVFWNMKFSKVQRLADQDGMTKDRIKIAYEFMLKKTKRILDIAAGQGFLEELLSKNSHLQIHANDISDIAINRLKRTYQGNFQLCDINHMKYKRNYFDAVFALEVLEHIQPFNILALIIKINKFLKRGGSFIVSVPVNEGLQYMINNPNGHTRDYNFEVLKSELNMCGFEVIKHKQLYAFKSLYKFKKISTLFLNHRWETNNIIVHAIKI